MCTPAARARAGTSFAQDAIVAILAGLALGAAFLDFRLWLVPWIAMAALVAIAARSAPRRAFTLGTLAGAAGIGVAFHWLVYAFRVFGGFSTPMALAIFVAPVTWMALEIGGFMALIAVLPPLPWELAAPLAFTTVEFLFPSLFPWRIAHTQYRVPLLLQSGDLAGPSLVTFAIVWVGAALASLWRAVRAGQQAPLRTAVPPLLLVLALIGYGAWRLHDVRAARDVAPALRIGVIQGNIGVERKGDRSSFTRNIEDYRTLSRSVAADVDVLIWPETVVQRPIAVTAVALHGSDDPFPDAPLPLLFGGLATGGDRHGRQLFNSAFLMRNDGRLVGRYDKRILVPFGEYMPFGDRFPRLRQLSPATSNFNAGHDAAVLPLSSAAQLGALICYEDVIPGPARDAVARGATLLVNLTNDAWYGPTAEPLQHQALAIWRAVETRRDLVRATNTGLTSVIAATGEVVGELPIFETAVLPATVRLLRGTTVYAAVGDVFAWTVVAATAAALVAARRRPRQ